MISTSESRKRGSLCDVGGRGEKRGGLMIVVLLLIFVRYYELF